MRANQVFGRLRQSTRLSSLIVQYSWHARSNSHHCLRQRARIRRSRARSVDASAPCAARLHSAGETGAERLCRKLQRKVSRRVPQSTLVSESVGRPARDRALAAGLQRGTAAQLLRRSHAERDGAGGNQFHPTGCVTIRGLTWGEGQWGISVDAQRNSERSSRGQNYRLTLGLVLCCPRGRSSVRVLEYASPYGIS